MLVVAACCPHFAAHTRHMCTARSGQKSCRCIDLCHRLCSTGRKLILSHHTSSHLLASACEPVASGRCAPWRCPCRCLRCVYHERRCWVSDHHVIFHRNSHNFSSIYSLHLLLAHILLNKETKGYDLSMGSDMENQPFEMDPLDDSFFDLPFRSPGRDLDSGHTPMDLFTPPSKINDTTLAPSDTSHDAADVSLNTPFKQHQFRCPLCNKSFTKKRSMTRHLHTVSCTGQAVPSQYHCPLCNLMFARKDDCTRHEKLQHGASRVKCPFCNRQVARRGLHEHRRSKRCLQTVQRHCLVSRTYDTRNTEIFEAPVLPLTVIAWRLLDPVQILQEVSARMRINLILSWKHCLHALCDQLQGRLPWSERIIISIFPWDDRAVLEAESLMLRIVRGNIADTSVHLDLSLWLQGLVAIAIVLKKEDEAAVHQRYLERMQSSTTRHRNRRIGIADTSWNGDVIKQFNLRMMETMETLELINDQVRLLGNMLGPYQLKPHPG